MPTPLLPSRDDDEHVDGTVVLWKEFGYRPFLDGWNEDPTHKGGEDSVEGRWMPLDPYNALLARANTAKVAAELMRARAEKAEAALNRVDRALWDVIGCVEDLNDCEGWHNSDPCSRSGKLNAACEVARAALSTQRGEGGA